MKGLEVLTISHFAGCVGEGVKSVSRTAKKIKSFSALPIGWHYGVGAPAPHHIVQIALQYLSHFVSLGMNDTNAFVGADGQILVAAYLGRHCLEITVEVDRSFTVSYDLDGCNKFYEPELSGVAASRELVRIANEIAGEECVTFDWSAWNTLNIELESSKTLHLRRLAMVRPSFPRQAQSLQADRCVGIFVNTTTESVENRLYSGFLNNRNLVLGAV